MITCGKVECIDKERKRSRLEICSVGVELWCLSVIASLMVVHISIYTAQSVEDKFTDYTVLTSWISASRLTWNVIWFQITGPTIEKSLPVTLSLVCGMCNSSISADLVVRSWISCQNVSIELHPGVPRLCTHLYTSTAIWQQHRWYKLERFNSVCILFIWACISVFKIDLHAAFCNLCSMSVFWALIPWYARLPYSIIGRIRILYNN